MNNKKAIVFLNESAGELEWITPILKYLLNNNFNIGLVYRSELIEKSIENNMTISSFLINHPQIKQHRPTWALKKIDKVGGYLYHYIGHKFDKVKLLSYCFGIFDRILGIIYMKNASKGAIKDGVNGRYLVFSQQSNLKRKSNFRAWIEVNFKNSVFIYHPHSPAVYSDKFEEDYPNHDKVSTKKRSYAILGNPGDFDSLESNRNYDVSKVNPVYIGHPKYSDMWTAAFNQGVPVSGCSVPNDIIKILITSHNNNSKLVCTEKEHQSIVSSLVKVFHKNFLNYQVIVKEHPRVTASYWNTVIEQNSSVSFTKRSVLEMACEVDFVISLLSSSPMDCFVVGAPVIEYLPVKPKIPWCDNLNESNTACRKLGIVLPADNEGELKNAIDKIISKDYRVSLELAHPFFRKIVKRSNEWSTHFEKILDANNMFLK